MESALELGFLVAATYVVIQTARNWRSLWDDAVTPSDWRLGRWAGWLASVPVGVVTHELGHVAAAKALGLTVTGINLGLNHGSVGVIGYANATQRWAVFVAGSVAVAVVCAVVIGLGLATRRPLIREMMMVGALLQLAVQLVIHPLISIGGWSDWSVIYDFRATPGLSSGAAAVHAAALVAFWLWWSTGLRWSLRAMRRGMEARRPALRRMVERERDPGVLARLADSYGSIGDFRSASMILRRAQVIDPAATEVLLARSQLAVRQRRWKAVLALTAEGLGDPTLAESSKQALWAYRGIALAALDWSGPAIEAFSHLEPPFSDHIQVRYRRGLARLAAGDRQLAALDLRGVVEDLPPHTLLRRHVDGLLSGRRSRWRARLLDAAGRVLRPDASVD